MVIFLTSTQMGEAVYKVGKVTPGCYQFLFLLNIILEKYSVKAECLSMQCFKLILFLFACFCDAFVNYRFHLKLPSIY